MIPVMCIVQEGQISPEAENGLKVEINQFILDAFATAADIDWIVVPKGNGFTAAKPSNTVIAALHANRALEQGERVRLLKKLGDICMAYTGRSAKEVVTSIRNPGD